MYLITMLLLCQQYFLTLLKDFDLLCSDVHVAVNCWDCVIVLCTTAQPGCLGRVSAWIFRGLFFGTTRCFGRKKRSKVFVPCFNFLLQATMEFMIYYQCCMWCCYVVWETTNYGFFMRKGINTRYAKNNVYRLTGSEKMSTCFFPIIFLF